MLGEKDEETSGFDHALAGNALGDEAQVGRASGSAANVQGHALPLPPYPESALSVKFNEFNRSSFGLTVKTTEFVHFILLHAAVTRPIWRAYCYSYRPYNG